MKGRKMESLEKAKRVAELVKLIEELREKKNRIAELNKYDNDKKDNVRPFFVEFGGPCVHTKYFITDNKTGDTIELFFATLFNGFLDKAKTELETLLK